MTAFPDFYHNGTATQMLRRCKLINSMGRLVIIQPAGYSAASTIAIYSKDFYARNDARLIWPRHNSKVQTMPHLAAARGTAAASTAQREAQGLPARMQTAPAPSKSALTPDRREPKTEARGGYASL